MEQSGEGIILRSLPFRDYDRILTLFTSEMGMVKIIMRGKRGQSFPYSPMTRIEFVIQEGKGDLWRGIELAVIDGFPTLRLKYELLETGAKMLKIIDSSQMQGKPAPLLYRLLNSYLGRLGHSEPSILLASFHLKVLRHEGVLETVIQGFSESENRQMETLAHSRSWDEIERIGVDSVTADKIEALFNSLT